MSEAFYPLDAVVAARRDLPPSAKVLYAVIRFKIGGNQHAWPGTRRLAVDTGMDRSTVIAALTRLEEAGLLVVQRRGNGQVNRYRLPEQGGGEIHPVESSNQSETPTGSGGENQPVGFSDRSEIPAGSGGKTPPEAVENPGRSQIPTGGNLPQGGGEIPPEAVGKSIRKRKEKNTEKNNIAAAPPDARVREFIDWFSEEYRRALGRPYIVIGPKDGAAVKRLLQSLTLDELRKAARVMLADSWAKGRADIGLLAGKINSWLAGQVHPPGRSGAFVQVKAATNYDSLVQKF